jgi:uncharacterized protein (DUF1697 family)
MAAVRVALLRGINVGRAKRIAMADLKSLIETLGYRDVRTLLNSGNVVFTVPTAVRGDAAARIEEGLATRLKVPARVTVLDGEELAAMVAKNPFGALARDPSRLLVAVPRRPADRARLAPLARRDWAPEAFRLGARAGFVWCPKGQLESPLFEALAKAMGEDVTTRNWATMTKLQALAEAIPSKNG